MGLHVPDAPRIAARFRSDACSSPFPPGGLAVTQRETYVFNCLHDCDIHQRSCLSVFRHGNRIRSAQVFVLRFFFLLLNIYNIVLPPERDGVITDIKNPVLSRSCINSEREIQ